MSVREWGLVAVTVAVLGVAPLSAYVLSVSFGERWECEDWDDVIQSVPLENMSVVGSVVGGGGDNALLGMVSLALMDCMVDNGLNVVGADVFHVLGVQRVDDRYRVFVDDGGLAGRGGVHDVYEIGVNFGDAWRRVRVDLTGGFDWERRELRGVCSFGGNDNYVLVRREGERSETGDVFFEVYYAGTNIVAVYADFVVGDGYGLSCMTDPRAGGGRYFGVYDRADGRLYFFDAELGVRDASLDVVSDRVVLGSGCELSRVSTGVVEVAYMFGCAGGELSSGDASATATYRSGDMTATSEAATVEAGLSAGDVASTALAFEAGTVAAGVSFTATAVVAGAETAVAAGGTATAQAKHVESNATAVAVAMAATASVEALTGTSVALTAAVEHGSVLERFLVFKGELEVEADVKGVSVSMDEFAGGVGCVGDGYEVQVGIWGREEWLFDDLVSFSSDMEIKQLDNFGEYKIRYRVRASSCAGGLAFSLWSDAVRFMAVSRGAVFADATWTPGPEWTAVVIPGPTITVAPANPTRTHTWTPVPSPVGAEPPPRLGPAFAAVTATVYAQDRRVGTAVIKTAVAYCGSRNRGGVQSYDATLGKLDSEAAKVGICGGVASERVIVAVIVCRREGRRINLEQSVGGIALGSNLTWVPYNRGSGGNCYRRQGGYANNPWNGFVGGYQGPFGVTGWQTATAVAFASGPGAAIRGAWQTVIADNLTAQSERWTATAVAINTRAGGAEEFQKGVATATAVAFVVALQDRSVFSRDATSTVVAAARELTVTAIADGRAGTVTAVAGLTAPRMVSVSSGGVRDDGESVVARWEPVGSVAETYLVSLETDVELSSVEYGMSSVAGDAYYGWALPGVLSHVDGPVEGLGLGPEYPQVYPAPYRDFPVVGVVGHRSGRSLSVYVGGDVEEVSEWWVSPVALVEVPDGDGGVLSWKLLLSDAVVTVVDNNVGSEIDAWLSGFGPEGAAYSGLGYDVLSRFEWSVPGVADHWEGVRVGRVDLTEGRLFETYETSLEVVVPFGKRWRFGVAAKYPGGSVSPSSGTMSFRTVPDRVRVTSVALDEGDYVVVEGADLRGDVEGVIGELGFGVTGDIDGRLVGVGLVLSLLAGVGLVVGLRMKGGS